MCLGRLPGLCDIIRWFSYLSVQAFTEWFQRRTNGSCSWLWTPYSDQEEEGVFLNMNNQEQASLLPWNQNQPNGGREENFAKISLNHFKDENKVKFLIELDKIQFFQCLTKSVFPKRWGLWILQGTVQVVPLANFKTLCFFV